MVRAHVQQLSNAKQQIRANTLCPLLVGSEVVTIKCQLVAKLSLGYPRDIRLPRTRLSTHVLLVYCVVGTLVDEVPKN
jgi:hypothetical protein